MDQLSNIVKYDSDDEISLEAENLETLLEEPGLREAGTRVKPLIEEMSSTTTESSIKELEMSLKQQCDNLSQSSKRFEEAAQRIEKAMSSMKTIVEGLVQVSADNLDIERTRLRVLEVNKASKREKYDNRERLK